MVITFIYGMSGCGKTYYIINKLSSFTAIAFTHSAVNNMKSMYLKMGKVLNENIVFSTIHKFLRIAIEPDGTSRIIRHFNFISPKTVIIDEFSLIPLDIIEYLFELGKNENVHYYFIGDFIQLPPISKIKFPINLSLVNCKFSSKIMTLSEALLISNHLSNTVFTHQSFDESEHIILTHNYRSNDNVMNILNKALNCEFDIINDEELKNLVLNDYVVISSTYQNLKKCYEKCYGNELIDMKFKKSDDCKVVNTKIGKTIIKLNQTVLLIENINNDFVNGDEVVITGIVDNKTIFIKSVNNPSASSLISSDKILPINFISCHKSQGRSIDKIIVILNDLFEITMLYTAITRAKTDVKFYSFDNVLPSKTEIDAFIKLKEIVYDE